MLEINQRLVAIQEELVKGKKKVILDKNSELVAF